MVATAQRKQVLAAGASWNFPLFHPVAKPRRWSHENPYLYQVIHRVEVAGRVVDEVTTSLGIRTFRSDPDKGFFLYEKPMLIKGVCNHHDAGNLGAVMPRAVLERRLRILKDIGVNAIRCSHNPMQDDLYDLCDRMGFLVMDEAFDEWELGKRKWVKGRNVGATNAIGLASMLDVAGYNYQEVNYDADHKAFPGRIIIGSENGHMVDAWHAVTDKPFISGQFLWTGFDFLGEANSWPSHGSHAGLFDTAGFIKPVGLLREALWSDRPVLHLAAHGADFHHPRIHWNKIADETGPVSVVAFSNLPEVTLELNGKVIGSAQPKDGTARWSVSWQAGRLVVTGKTADGKTLTDQLQSTGPAARIRLTADRPLLRNDGRDAVHVIIDLLDDAGLPVSGDDRLVTVSIANPARLAALENGDQEDNTPAKSASRKTRAGKALAIVQASGTGTSATITVSADGLPSSEIRLELVSDGSP